MPYDRHAWIPIQQEAPPIGVRVLAVGPECGCMIVIFRVGEVFDPIGQDVYHTAPGILSNDGYYAFSHWLPLPDTSIMFNVSLQVPASGKTVIYVGPQGHVIGSRVQFKGTPQSEIYWDDRKGVKQNYSSISYWIPLPEEPAYQGTSPPAPINS